MPRRCCRPSVACLLVTCLLASAAWLSPGAKAEEPVPADPAVLGVNLVAPPHRDHWRHLDETGALAWSTDEENPGLAFVAKAIPEHNTGRDHLELKTGIGAGSFDLSAQLSLELAAGHSAFMKGLMLAMTSAPLDEMGESDAAAVLVLHAGAVSGGMTRGKPYHLPPPGVRVHHNLMTRHAPEGWTRRHGFTDELQSVVATDRPLMLRIRRDALDRVHFAVWAPHLGQTPARPFWSSVWELPESIRDMPLDHLVIRRAPIEGVHLGAEGRGYGDIFQLRGRITELTLRSAPPTITTARWASAEQDGPRTIEVLGAELPENVKATVGGEAMPVVDHRPDRLRLDAAGLATREPTRLDVTVTTPGGLSATLTDALPVGRRLVEASNLLVDPRGGVVTLHGYGFTPGTTLAARDEAGRVIARARRIDSTTLRLDVPPREEAGAPTLRLAWADGAGGASDLGSSEDAGLAAVLVYAERPRLWFGPEGMERLRRRSMDPTRRPYRDRLLKMARGSLRNPPRRVHHGFATHVTGMAWGWILTGEQPFRDALKARLMRLLRSENDPTNADFIQTLALGYDLVAHELSPEDRLAIERMLREAVDVHNRAVESGEWAVTAPYVFTAKRWLAATMAAAALGDLDRLEHDPTEALRRYAAVAQAPDGAMIEGLNWSGTGFDAALATTMLLRHHGRDVADPLAVDRLPALYAATAATPTDAVKFANTYGGYRGVLAAATAGARHEDPLSRWIADRAAEAAGRWHFNETGLAILVRDDTPAPENPRVPLTAHLDRAQWAIVRSEPRLDADRVLALRGSRGPIPYHQQRDVGMFQLYAYGKELLFDTGWGQVAAKQHNLPVIDGVDGGTTGASITHLEAIGPWRIAVIDATDVYRRAGVRRYRRTLAMHADGPIVLLEDILPAADASGRVEAYFQTAGGELDADGSGFTTTHENVGLHAQRFGPDAAWASESFRHRHRHDTDWLRFIARYDADPDRPAVYVFTVGDDGVPEAVDASARYAGDAVTVALGEYGDLTWRRMAAGQGWALAAPVDGDRDDGPRLLASAVVRAAERVATATRVESEAAPRIDGRLDDAAWSDASPVKPTVRQSVWPEQAGEPAPTTFRFAWDDKALYIGARLVDPDGEFAVRLDGPAQSTAGDDSVLVMLDPGLERSTNRYGSWHFLASGKALGRYGKGGDLGRPDVDFASRVEDGVWTLEVRLPWDSVTHDPWEKLGPWEPKAGRMLGLNLLRSRVTQEGMQSWVWQGAVTSPTSTPWRWGLLKLAE